MGSTKFELISMAPSEIVPALSEPTSTTSSSSCSGSVSHRNSEDKRRFVDLRGVRWRINLGVLPSSSLASIDDLRRVTADSRRRFVFAGFSVFFPLVCFF